MFFSLGPAPVPEGMTFTEYFSDTGGAATVGLANRVL